MSLVKKLFDRSVAQQLTDQVDSFIGMPGASLQSFKRPAIGQRVFHAVDGHPAVLNELLQLHYGRAARREVVATVQVERIESELELADIVLAPSEAVQRQMLSRGVPADRIFIEPYGVDFRLFSPERSTDVNVSPQLLYVGQISYRKGIPFLLDAVRGQRLSLKMVGPVVAPELLENLPANVTYEGAVGHENLPKHFAEADAFVLPSIEDAFALVVAEALGVGLPVVTTTSVGASTLITSASDGQVVAPGDVSALRNALAQVMPLTQGDRIERAERHRAPHSGVRSWEQYAAGVARAIGAAA